MANVTFVLKKPNEKTKTLILAMLRFYNYRIPLSIGEQILPSKWDTDNGRPKPSRSDDKAENLNNRLQSIRKRMLKAYADHFERNHRIILAELKEELRVIARPVVEEKSKDMSLVGIAKEYIEICNKKNRTIANYNDTIKIVEKYQKANKKILYPDDVNMEFYYSFVKWLEKKDNAKNTIGNYIKEIKVFMNYANDKKYTKSVDYKNDRFRVLMEESDTIYLTDEEILQLYNLDLPNRFARNTRDAFVISCYTGLRHSDLKQLSMDKFLDNNTKVKIVTRKTGETVIIPLHWTIKKILERREGKFPKVYSNFIINKRMKLLAEEAKITDLVSKTITRGGKQESKSYRKCDLVTVHTARRSFATNAFKAGISPYFIMKITGHKTESAFLKYIKIDSEQSASLIENHAFFTEPEK